MDGNSPDIATGSQVDRTKASRRLPTTRSRVGNGSAILPDVDGRTAPARRLKDILAQLVSDIGGSPSEAQTQLIRRAANLSVWCENAEAGMARGEAFDVAEFTTACNTLRRLLTDIGLERRAKDVTPTIADYMRQARADVIEAEAA